MLTDLARLESAFPGFSFAIRDGRRGPSFEAWRNTTRSGLYAIITDDPCELWRELEMIQRLAAGRPGAQVSSATAASRSREALSLSAVVDRARGRRFLSVSWVQS